MSDIIDDLPDKIKVDDNLLKPKRGAPTTLEKRRNAPPVRGKVKGRRTHYSEKEKINACCVFAVSGNSRRTAELTKIPEATIRQWKQSHWWNDVTTRIYSEQDEELSGKLTKLVDKAVDEINDRLEDGDYVYNPKLDKIIRKPINAKDVAGIAVMAVDKRQLLRGQPTSRTESVSQDQRLKALADEFKKFSKAKEVKQDLSIEEVDIDAG